MKQLVMAVLLFTAVCAFSDVFADQAQTPRYGGTFRRIDAMSPQVLGYYPEMGQWDIGSVYPCIEFLMNMNEKRQFVPFLAESVIVDEKKLTMTFHLRKGIKFHDGSDLNAEVAAWNFKMLLEGKKVRFGENIKSVEVAAPYRVVLHLNDYNNQMLFGYGFTPMFSKQAFETKGKEWCRLNPVGTGPFKFVAFRRDEYLKFEKFPGYWQHGKPYLDAVEFRYVPDTVTASQMFQAKQAEMFMSPPPREQADLMKKGFVRQSDWPALPAMLYLNTGSGPLSNQKVREAIDYALDKPAMAKAIGFGFYTALKAVAPETEWGYDPTYAGRPYNPEKAKQLLAEAGYPHGLKVKLLAYGEAGGKNNTAEAVKAYMDQAGFTVDIDIADPGRFFGSLWVKGWDDMALFFNGLDVNYLQSAETWFGHQPLTNLVSFKRPPEFLALCKEAVKLSKEADQKEATRKIVRMIADEAFIIPLWNIPGAVMVQPYVHTTFLHNGLINWAIADDWMENH